MTLFYSEPVSRGTRGPAGPLVPLLNSYSYYCCKICCTTVCTRFEGIAKLTPFAAVFDSVLTAVNVGIPMSCPCKLIKCAPPPGHRRYSCLPIAPVLCFHCTERL